MEQLVKQFLHEHHGERYAVKNTREGVHPLVTCCGFRAELLRQREEGIGGAFGLGVGLGLRRVGDPHSHRSGDGAGGLRIFVQILDSLVRYNRSERRLRKMADNRRHHDEEFKRRAVRWNYDSDRTVTSIA